MIQKSRGKEKVRKPVKIVKPINKPIKSNKAIKVIEVVKPTKSTKKYAPVGRAMGNKSIDEVYDRGFNDGYAKGLEDGGLDESK